MTLSLGTTSLHHAPVQHLLGGPLAGGHHIVVAPLGAEEMLGHQSHAVAGDQAAVSVGDFHPGILRGDGHIAQHGGIPVEAGARNGADSGHIQVKHHILDQVGIVKILVLEALGGQFRINLPAVGIGLNAFQL